MEKQITRTFPLEKILTVSAKDYITFQSTAPLGYFMRGVHLENGSINEFAAQVPAEAEVVVAYRRNMSSDIAGIRYSHSGTALITKKR